MSACHDSFLSAWSILRKCSLLSLLDAICSNPSRYMTHLVLLTWMERGLSSNNLDANCSALRAEKFLSSVYFRSYCILYVSLPRVHKSCSIGRRVSFFCSNRHIQTCPPRGRVSHSAGLCCNHIYRSRRQISEGKSDSEELVPPWGTSSRPSRLTARTMSERLSQSFRRKSQLSRCEYHCGRKYNYRFISNSTCKHCLYLSSTGSSESGTNNDRNLASAVIFFLFCFFHPPVDGEKYSFSSPHFHVFSCASCVDLTRLLSQPNRTVGVCCCCCFYAVGVLL